MNTWLWSDTHFNHAGILRHAAETRPYTDVLEMNDALVRMWNERVGPHDRMFFIGDFGFSNRYGEPLDQVFAALNGEKHLVIGNHDEQNPKVLALPWETQTTLTRVKDQGNSAVLCHYALETWARQAAGRLMCHGHSHGTLERWVAHRFDVGVDAMGVGGPLELAELAVIAGGQQWDPVDHHADDR